MRDEDIAFVTLTSLILAALLVLLILFLIPKRAPPLEENKACIAAMSPAMIQFFQITRNYARHLRDYIKTPKPTPQQDQALETDLNELESTLQNVPYLAPELKTLFSNYGNILQALRESRGRPSPSDDDIQSRMNDGILAYVQSRAPGIDRSMWWKTLFGAYTAWYNWMTTFVQNGSDVSRYWTDFQTNLAKLVVYLCL